MTLDQSIPGQEVLIDLIEDQKIKLQTIRLGIYEGYKVKCILNSKSGPVILKNKMQEIAIGKAIAKKILVRAV